MHHIAIAGFQHETNTFVSKPTTLAQFQASDSWPEILLGSDLISGTRGMNLPVTAIVTSNPIQCLDQAHFTYFDVDLTAMQTICVKSTLHYRADFEHLVDRVVSVASAGQFPGVLTPDTYSKLPEPMTFL